MSLASPTIPAPAAATTTPFSKRSLSSTLSDHNRELVSALLVSGISDAQIESLITNYRDRSGARAFSECIVEFGYATERQVAGWIAKITKLALVSGAELLAVQQDAVRLLNANIARLRGALPIRRESGVLIVAIHDTEVPQFAQVKHALVGVSHRFVIAPKGDILAAIEAAFISTVAFREENEWALFIESLYKEMALTDGASDLHFIPEEKSTTIKFRVDGKLVAKKAVEFGDKEKLISAVKLSAGRGEDGVVKVTGLGGLDVSQKLKPQDGSAIRKYGSRRLALRFSSIPTINGESVVIRFLDQDAQVGDLGTLGMMDDHAKIYKEYVCKPEGLILNCGPTGHGKSTTLAAAVQYLEIHTKRVMTIEDPVEYRLRGVTQIQAHPEQGYGYASILRALMRHNPNIIILGEMRDKETAVAGLSLAQTGHMLLTTAHANTAIGGIARLLDLGVSAVLMAPSLQLMLGQRLVRRICTSCRQIHSTNEVFCLQNSNLIERATEAGLIKGPATFYEAGGGCQACNGTGFRGRIGIFELRPIRRSVRDRLVHAASSFDVADAELEYTKDYNEGNLAARTMTKDGIIKAANGFTTMEEIMAATSTDVV